MKIEIIKEFLHGVDKLLVEEVIISQEGTEYDEATCKYLCDAGIAKDLLGDYPTGNPSYNDVILHVKDITSDQQIIVLGE